jgi:hypothetical protein
VHAELVRDLAHAVQACGVDLEHALNVSDVRGPRMGRTAHCGYR